MGYFSNGTEGELYHEVYCARCVHDEHEDCAVWSAHLAFNYDECNKSDSILHMLIPRSKGGGNEKCEMFIDVTRHARAIEALRGCVDIIESAMCVDIKEKSPTREPARSSLAAARAVIDKFKEATHGKA